MRWIALAWVALAACSSGPEQRASVEGEDARAVADQPKPMPGAGYEVAVEVSRQARAGQATIAWVHVRPHDPWHMNLEFPARLDMHAVRGVHLDAARLERVDAERLDATGLVFPVVFTPDKSHRGPTTLSGEVHFAVCGTAECAPVQEAVEFTVVVS